MPGFLRVHVSIAGGVLAAAETVGPGIFGNDVIARDLNGDGTPDAAVAGTVSGVQVVLTLGCGM
jgi:hypothetical protein